MTSGTGQIGTGGVSNGGAVSVNGATVTVPLTNIANAQAINVTLFGVSNGSGASNVVVPMHFLLGDTNGDGFGQLGRYQPDQIEVGTKRRCD